MKKVLAMILALCMVFALVACGQKPADKPATSDAPPASQPATPDAPSAPEVPAAQEKGSIMWLSNLTDGIQYETTVAYLTAICEKLGYDELIVTYGSGMNDAAENLQFVQNNMTDDVAGLIFSQDGGIGAIMEEYPDLWVVGYNTDARSIYTEGGENSACLNNPKFLGTIADGYGNGFQLGVDNANAVIEKGYKKVSIINFPPFAYPNLTEATMSFIASIEEYNKTAAEPIEIVGEPTTLMFAPLEESWFLEGRQDLDAIIAFCAGALFVYPTLKTAIANGNCAADTVMLTGGFDDTPEIIADMGDGKTIAFTQISPAEDPAYCMILIDKAITGTLPADFKNLCIDSAPYTIDSTEDIDNVMTKSMAGTADISLAQLTVDEVAALAQDASLTHAALIEKMQSEQLTVDALKSR